jgi:formate dehydrogenase subunit delta
MPDPIQARKDIADHIRRFWEPRMRKLILAHVDDGGVGLHPIVADALRDNYEALKPKS